MLIGGGERVGAHQAGRDVPRGRHLTLLIIGNAREDCPAISDQKVLIDMAPVGCGPDQPDQLYCGCPGFTRRAMPLASARCCCGCRRVADFETVGGRSGALLWLTWENLRVIPRASSANAGIICLHRRCAVPAAARNADDFPGAKYALGAEVICSATEADALPRWRVNFGYWSAGKSTAGRVSSDGWECGAPKRWGCAWQNQRVLSHFPYDWCAAKSCFTIEL